MQINRDCCVLQVVYPPKHSLFCYPPCRELHNHHITSIGDSEKNTLIYITPVFISGILANLNPTKSPGFDNIHPRILRMFALIILRSEATLFSLISLLTGHIMSDWQWAVVKPFLEKGSLAEASNCRPIGLISVPCVGFQANDQRCHHRAYL